MQNGILLPLFYHPPIEYFNKIFQNPGTILIESCEHFPKQTYRNRASIHSANGMLDLTVPLHKGKSIHTPVKDVKISYEFNWQRLHWLSIQASYRSSAFFEFYEDEFAPFYEKKYDFLFDYNLKILALLFKLLKLNAAYNFTQAYEKEYPGIEDCRNTIHPKIKSAYQTKPYFQVFDDRNGFMPNLSVIDLLFNQGTKSGEFIESSQ